MSTPENTEKRIVVYVPSKGGNGRPLDSEMENRIGHVTKMLLEGEPYSEIVAKCSELWGVCSRTTDRYIASATKKIKAIVDHDVKSTAIININYLRLAAKLGERIGQPSVCVAAVKEINSMLGIGPDTIIASNKFGDSITFTLHRERPENPTPKVSGSENPHLTSEEEDNSDLVMEPIDL